MSPELDHHTKFLIELNSVPLLVADYTHFPIDVKGFCGAGLVCLNNSRVGGATLARVYSNGSLRAVGKAPAKERFDFSCSLYSGA